MHTWHVQTACYDRSGQLIGAGGMYVDAATPADAERKAIRIEPGEGCTAYRRAGLVTA